MRTREPDLQGGPVGRGRGEPRVVAAFLLLLTLLGCGADEREAEVEAADALPEVGIAAASGPDTVEVLMDEYSISMPSTVPAGPNVVRFANAGFEEHNIYFRRKGEESPAWTLERRMNPGERRVATVELDPGSYTAICDFSGHDGRGMFVDFAVLAEPGGSVP